MGTRVGFGDGANWGEGRAFSRLFFLAARLFFLAAEQTGGLVQEEDEHPIVPAALLAEIAALGGKPAPKNLRKAILDLCELGWWTPRSLADVLKWKDTRHLSEKHLAPLLKEGTLQRRYPDNPAHPSQAYRSSQAPLPGIDE